MVSVSQRAASRNGGTSLSPQITSVFAVIRLASGETLDTGAITSVRGHAYDPLTTEELWEKFRDCTVKTHSESEARTLFDRSQAIVQLTSASELPTATSLFVDPGKSTRREFKAVV